MKKKQALNPYLPGYEYIPDAEPHIVGDRIYIYGSHDKFNGLSFCLGDYVCYSASIDDLSNWKYEGTILEKKQDPFAKPIRVINGMAAPDMVQGSDGKFYLYYFIGGTGRISVAVCDEPGGKYEFYDYVHYEDGIHIGKKGEPFMFDPGVFMDDDGKLYLYVGFGLKSNPFILGKEHPTLIGPMCFELDPNDMVTVKRGPMYIGVAGEKNAPGTDYEGHAFLEASSMRKFNDTYYYIYSSLNSHDLCYAYSKYPDREFKYDGVLVSNGDIGLPGVTGTRHAHNDTGNTHGSLIKIKDKYYVFYHRHTNRKQSCRQACAEEIRFENGKFYQAEMTSCGLNNGPLDGKGIYSTRICCNLYGRRGTRFLTMIKRPSLGLPYITQDSRDYNPDTSKGKKPVQYIANMCDGAVAGFKYFDLRCTSKINLNLRGNAQGQITIYGANKLAPICEIPICLSSKRVKEFGCRLLEKGTNKEPLFFKFTGTGSFDFVAFELQ